MKFKFPDLSSKKFLMFLSLLIGTTPLLNSCEGEWGLESQGFNFGFPFQIASESNLYPVSIVFLAVNLAIIFLIFKFAKSKLKKESFEIFLLFPVIPVFYFWVVYFVNKLVFALKGFVISESIAQLLFSIEAPLILYYVFLKGAYRSYPDLYNLMGPLGEPGIANAARVYILIFFVLTAIIITIYYKYKKK